MEAQLSIFKDPSSGPVDLLAKLHSIKVPLLTYALLDVMVT